MLDRTEQQSRTNTYNSNLQHFFHVTSDNIGGIWISVIKLSVI